MLHREVEQFFAGDTSLDEQSVHAFANQGLECELPAVVPAES